MSHAQNGHSLNQTVSQSSELGTKEVRVRFPLPVRLVVRLWRRPTRMLALCLIVSVLLSLNPEAPRVLAEATVKQVNGRLVRRVSRWSNNVRDQVRRAFPERKSEERVVEESYNNRLGGLELSKPLAVPQLAVMFAEPPDALQVFSRSASQIKLSWAPSVGTVDHYVIERTHRVDIDFSFLGNSTTTTFTDSTVIAGTAYLYRVRAVSPGGVPSLASTMAFGTAVTFADEVEPFPSLPANARIKAVHFSELRQAVDAVRALAGLSTITWTPQNLQGLTVQAQHVNDLRQHLALALQVLEIPQSTYTNASLQVNVTEIRRVHVEQLRSRSTLGSSNGTGEDFSDTDLYVARLDPLNQTGGGGENPLSRNYNWNLPIVILPGRSGHSLSLGLSYNSLVWTKIGNSILFDADRGFPSPGFRLGFASIEGPYPNSETGKLSYLLIGSDGSRTDLRQVSTNSTFYESADSSHTLLDTALLSDPVNPRMTLRTTDGTQLTYAMGGSSSECTEIKDSNGNYISVSYNTSGMAAGNINEVTDTLNRKIKFNYHPSTGVLETITQVWTRQTPENPHVWAHFSYYQKEVQTNFANQLTKIGPVNGQQVKVLKEVTLADSTTFAFDYTSFGQIWKISQYGTDAQLMNYRSYDLPSEVSIPENDCPRFTTRKDWAKNWNRTGADGPAGLPNGTEQEIPTATWVPWEAASWHFPNESTNDHNGVVVQVTQADGSYNKIYYEGQKNTNTGWSRGLASMIETFGKSTPEPSSQIIKQRTSVSKFVQDSPAPYLLNPRTLESYVYDFDAGGTIKNRAKTGVTYHEPLSLGDGMSIILPNEVIQFQGDSSTKLRWSITSYESSSQYLARRIIGLPKLTTDYERDTETQAEKVTSKVEIEYDAPGSITETTVPVQHDGNVLTARGNVSVLRRYDTTPSSSAFLEGKLFYNTSGSVVKQLDPAGHQTLFDYTDKFYKDGLAADPTRNFITLAYPTTTTDPDNYTLKARYYYDFGAITWRQTPQAGTQSNVPGPEEQFLFDDLGRPLRNTNLANEAYTRFDYGPNYVESFTTINSLQEEVRWVKVFDGSGRVIGVSSSHPNSEGGYSSKLTLYDKLGRVSKQSNPVETGLTVPSTPTLISPYSWAAVGADDLENDGFGWVYSEQTFDWKQRPIKSKAPDGTAREFSYEGCGCAGGAVVTSTDAGTYVGTTIKRRQQRQVADALGRVIKTEVLDWEGNVYSATKATYNGRDQLTQLRQFAGSENSTVFQDTIITYDGYGRVSSKRNPEDQPGTFTTWEYNPDDSPKVITDPRGATSTFTYNNNRKLVNVATYEMSGSPTITYTYAYDSVGNRSHMTDPSGDVAYNYNALSQLTSEVRNFTSLSSQSYTLSYSYNLAGQIKTFSLPSQWGNSLTYGYDAVGRLTGLTGTGYSYSDPNIIQVAVPVPVPTFLSSIKYRAWNDPKEITDGHGVKKKFNYDVNLRPANFLITDLADSATMEWNYSYHPDGNIRLASDLADSDFDKKYEFDHVGRIVEAYSGREARGEAATTPFPDSPYRQTNLYDHFGNLRQQSGRVWQKTLSAELYTFTNNRRPGLTYDNKGQVILDPQGQHVFDSQGQRSRVTAGTVGGGDTGNPEAPAQEVLTTYDGLGLPASELRTSRSETFVGQGPQTNIFVETALTYYLRSSVLGAIVVAELNSQGVRTNEYISAAGQRIATHVVSQWNEGINWEQKVPVTDAWVSTAVPFRSPFRTEVDPTGRVTGNDLFEMPLNPPEEPEPTRDPTYLIEGGPTWEAEIGMQEYEAIYVSKKFGAAAGSGQNSFGSKSWEAWQREKELQRMAGNHSLFGMDLLNANIPGTYEWVEAWVQVDDGKPVDLEGQIVPSLVPVDAGYYRLVPGQSQSQQKSGDYQQKTDNDTRKRMDLGEAFSILDENCRHFLNSILAELSRFREPYSYNIGTLLREAQKMDSLSTVILSKEELKKRLGGTHKVFGHPEFFVEIDERQFNRADLSGGYVLFHEFGHGAATGEGYNHYEMAQAAWAVATSDKSIMKQIQNWGHNKPPRFVDYTSLEGYNDGDDTYNALLFDTVVRIGCPNPNNRK